MGEALKIGVLKELKAGERRVAIAPQTVSKFIKLGFQVQVQAGAGNAANFRDEDYIQENATIVSDAKQIWETSDLILKINAPLDEEVDLIKPKTFLASLFFPAQNEEMMKKLADKQITLLAMDCIPRISRAQKMDVLSSMANIAGYRAMIEASNVFGRFFTGQITAAGRIPPAKVMVIGAGVAGLSAIGTANSMGAIVRAFDTRPEVKEQVQSMGAEFLELDFEEDGSGEGGYAKVMSKEFIDAEMKLFEEQAREVDIIVTTALIPGKKAPTLITEHMVKVMKEGSVVVDLAAEQGGNCELTEHGKIVVKHGVNIIGYSDLPSRLPTQSSQLFGANLAHLLSDMTNKGEAFRINLEDEVVRGALILQEGQVMWPPPKVVQPSPKQAPKKDAPAVSHEVKVKKPSQFQNYALGALAVLLFFIGQSAPEGFLSHFSTFVLACIIGWQVVWNVSPSLHTPLMSVTNAISGIIIIGALVQVGTDLNLPTILALLAVVLASINIAGGFLVTKRMLKMFHK